MICDILGFLAFLAVCTATAATGARFRPGPWYEGLAKPFWTPPNWIFAPVWTVLYVMIAVAGFLVWTQGETAAVALPLIVYGLQLVLNALWSYLFFGIRRPDLAFADILVLWLAVLATVLLFFPVAPIAGWLLIPYLLWVSFAIALNYSVWQLNRNRSDTPAGADPRS
ncbi:MAG: TspO/MBR family protein [Pseudomonadota bacterium]